MPHSPGHARVGSALIRMLHRIEEAQARAATQSSIHTTDFRCLSYLRMQDGPISPRQIVDYLGLTSGACTALLDRLEQAGYIRRLPNPNDRRSVLILLDEVAAAEQIALLDDVHRRYREAVVDFSDADLETIAAYLDKVAALVAQDDAEAVVPRAAAG
jgi:DNA-binding MarR family transcriptional regulator